MTDLNHIIFSNIRIYKVRLKKKKKGGKTKKLTFNLYPLFCPQPCSPAYHQSYAHPAARKRGQSITSPFDKDFEDGNFNGGFLDRKRQPQVGSFLAFPCLKKNLRGIMQKLDILNFAGQSLEPDAV